MILANNASTNTTEGDCGPGTSNPDCLGTYTKKVLVKPASTKIIDIPDEKDKIRQLEKQIQQLETEIKRKDAVIQEQVKTIIDLFNRMSKVFFEPFNLPLLGI